jgi:hypothetical protein
MRSKLHNQEAVKHINHKGKNRMGWRVKWLRKTCLRNCKPNFKTSKDACISSNLITLYNVFAEKIIEKKSSMESKKAPK